MKAISLISAANVETLVSMLSSMPKRAKSWCRIGNDAYAAGTLFFVSTDSVITRGVRIQAPNLGHDEHQSDGADVGALATHVASSNDLEARLLGGVDIVGDEIVRHQPLLDRVPASLNSESISELRSSVVVHRYKL